MSNQVTSKKKSAAKNDAETRHLEAVAVTQAAKPKAPKGGQEWPALTEKELQEPGATLLALLIEASKARGLTLNGLAEGLDMSYSYVAGLRNGSNHIHKIGVPVAQKIAAFLEMPVVAVMLAGGLLSDADFHQKPETLENHILPALKFIQRDSEFGCFMPPSLFSADQKTQLLVIRLYEAAKKRTLIPGLHTPQGLLQRFETLTGNTKHKR